MILAIKLLQESVLGDSVIEWLSLFTLLGGITAIYRHIECHEEGCRRIGKYPHGHVKLCGKHHPNVSGDSKKDIEDISEVLKS
jgi:hypothetical protein